MPRLRPLLALAVAASAGLGACGDGEGASEGCGPILREALDASYLVHVLGTETDVEYSSDPPTSGPHQPSPPVDGVVTDPLTKPIQVGILERGDVLVQYEPTLGEEALAQLEGLAGDGIVVAPNPDLPDPVVATAWTYKRTCSGVEVDALREFADQRLGRGPED